MERPFDILCEALEQLSWDADTQRRAFTDAAVTDELALDLDNAARSLPHQAERLGITLDPELITDLTALLALLDALPGDPLWDPASLDTHPTWTTARRTAARLIQTLH